MDKKIKSRLIHKHDIEANWLKATNFIPLAGEEVVYEADENHNYPRIKIGDGVTPVTDLPFLLDNSVLSIEQELSTTEQEQARENIGAAAESEAEDARIDFEGNEHETLGDAIRAQGVKIEIDDSEALGENILNQDAWRALNEGEIISANDGVITVSHNERYGDYLEQIKESKITPHVGYYLYRNFDELKDEWPDEAVYLTNAEVASQSYVKGATLECDFSKCIPAAVLELDCPTRLGRVDIICKQLDGVPTEFDIQVKTLSGEWVIVKSGKPEDGLFTKGKLYQNFLFDPIVGTAVRVLIHDCYGDFPKILEITLHEVKSGRLLERVRPTSFDTRVDLRGGSLESTQDGNRSTYCETFSFTEPDTSEPEDSDEAVETELVEISDLAAPIIGHYVDNDTDGEIIEYSHGTHVPANAVNGNTTDQARFDYFTHAEIESGAKIPVMFFYLGEEKPVGALEVYGYEAYRYNMEDFDVQVIVDGAWKTVASAENAFHVEGAEFGDDLTGDNQSLKLYFDDIYTTSAVRILVRRISDMSPDGAEDAEMMVGGSIRVTEVKIYEAVPKKRQDNPIPFEFIFDEDVVINKFRIFAFKRDNYTPKSIFMTGKVDGEWVDIYGSANPPDDGSGDKYVSKEIYPEGFTDTFVHNLDKDYKVSAIRLYVTDRVGINEDGTPKDGQLILNEIEFYGPAAVSESKETSIGVAYDEYDADLTQKAGDVWYFGAKVSGEKYEYGSSLNRPEVVLEADVNGEHKELCASMTASESLEDYYCTFTITEDYEGPFANMLVKVQYPNSSDVKNKTSKFSDFVLVNLTEAYGAGNEPVADDYYKALRTSTMTIHSQEGSIEFKSVTGPRGAAGKTAYEYAVEGGYAGTEEEFTALMNSDKISTYSQDKGNNVLENSEVRGLPRSEIISEQDGIISVISNPYHGQYLEQIKESTITPHVGYYMTGSTSLDIHGDIELVDEVPEEAKYLTDAIVGIAADVKGSTDLPHTYDEGYAVFSEGVVPVAVLDLAKPTLVGAVELTCRIRDHAPVAFCIQVKNLSGIWETVTEVNGHGAFTDNSTAKYTFDPVMATNIRVMIASCFNEYPKILEIAVYEAKYGKILQKIDPISVATEAYCDDGSIEAIVNGDKNVGFHSGAYTRRDEEDGKVRPIPFVFNFADNTLISKVRILPYHNEQNAPAKIILDALVDGKWIDLVGSPDTPSIGSDGNERPYTNVPLYDSELKDTAVIDLGKEYKVSAIRLYVTSIINGVAPLILNEVEFYGPAQSSTGSSNEIGIVYNDNSHISITEDNEVWYFGAKVRCEGRDRADQVWGIDPPRVLLDYTNVSESGTAYTYNKDLGVLSKEVFEDVGCTFRLDRGSISDIKLYVKYPNGNKENLICKFTDAALVNLSQAYGEDIEPSAEEYVKYRNTALMSVQTPEGIKKYIFGTSEEPPVKSVNGMTGDVTIDVPVKSVNGQTGHVNLNASSVGAAPSGYGWGETIAREPTNNNLDYCKTTGVYRVNGNTVNNPAVSDKRTYGCNLVLVHADGKNVYQTALCEDGRIATRCYYDFIGDYGWDRTGYRWSPWEWPHDMSDYIRITDSAKSGQIPVVHSVDANGKPYWDLVDAFGKEDVDNAVLITIDDIDEIWGGAPVTPAEANSISE